MTTEELIKSTWEECGVKGVRALGTKIFVRTEPLPQKIGSIWLPPKMTSFYGTLPHLRLVVGIVLAAGPLTEVKPGERICFMRLHFARWKNLGNEVYVGWIGEHQLIGFYTGEYETAMAFSRGSKGDTAYTESAPEAETLVAMGG